MLGVRAAYLRCRRCSGRLPTQRVRGYAEALTKQPRECAAVFEAAGQRDFGNRQRTRAQQPARAQQALIDEIGVRRLLISGAERADEMPRRVAGHACQHLVVQIKVAIRGEIVAYALQAQKHLATMRIRASRTAMDCRAEFGLHAEYAFDQCDGGIFGASARGNACERYRLPAQSALNSRIAPLCPSA